MYILSAQSIYCTVIFLQNEHDDSQKGSELMSKIFKGYKIILLFFVVLFTSALSYNQFLDLLYQPYNREVIIDLLVRPSLNFLAYTIVLLFQKESLRK